MLALQRDSVAQRYLLAQPAERRYTWKSALGVLREYFASPARAKMVIKQAYCLIKQKQKANPCVSVSCVIAGISDKKQQETQFIQEHSEITPTEVNQYKN